MKHDDLESEVQAASDRLEVKKTKIEGELAVLDVQVSRFTRLAWFFVWIGAVVALVSLLVFFFTNDDSGFGLNLLGDFMAGSVASLWSLAGLFFIYVAFLGQKQQLLNQRLEIMYSQLEVKFTRLELAGQKLEMKQQNLTLRQQKFENTFFQMLQLFNTNIDSIDLRNVNTGTIMNTGRDCFKKFYEYLEKDIKGIVHGSRSSKKSIASVSVENAVMGYEKLYTNYKSDLSHYFRTFYHIIKLIDSSEIKNKRKYISLARAQLSSFEQVLLFYNCLHNNGREKFKPLIERYGLLKNLDFDLLVNEDHASSYESGAFESCSI